MLTAPGDGALVTLPPEIAKWVKVDPVTGCWRYTRRHDRDGYGRIGAEGAHRVVWRLLRGEIPAGRVLDHVKARGCAWHDCVNVAHLEPVTPRVNTLRGRSFAAVNARKTRCDHGHEFDLLNTYWYGSRRCCRRCNLVAVTAYKRRKRAQLTRAALGWAA